MSMVPAGSGSGTGVLPKVLAALAGVAVCAAVVVAVWGLGDSDEDVRLVVDYPLLPLLAVVLAAGGFLLGSGADAVDRRRRSDRGLSGRLLPARLVRLLAFALAVVAAVWAAWGGAAL